MVSNAVNAMILFFKFRVWCKFDLLKIYLPTIVYIFSIDVKSLPQFKRDIPTNLVSGWLAAHIKPT